MSGQNLFSQQIIIFFYKDIIDDDYEDECENFQFVNNVITVKTCPRGHLYSAVICDKMSHYSCPIIENFILIEPLLRGCLS
jgi:hypothetical protein